MSTNDSMSSKSSLPDSKESAFYVLCILKYAVNSNASRRLVEFGIGSDFYASLQVSGGGVAARR
jgi:hypothetical protein